MSHTADILDFVAEKARRSGDNRAEISAASVKLAAELDRELLDAVTRLEEVAACQQAQTGQLSAEERGFIRFCTGLEEVGLQLLDHLAERYLAHLTDAAAQADQLWIYQTRASSLIAWIGQLAQVHGLAFDDPLIANAAHSQPVLSALTDRLYARMNVHVGSFRNCSSDTV